MLCSLRKLYGFIKSDIDQRAVCCKYRTNICSREWRGQCSGTMQQVSKKKDSISVKRPYRKICAFNMACKDFRLFIAGCRISSVGSVCTWHAETALSPELFSTASVERTYTLTPSNTGKPTPEILLWSRRIFFFHMPIPRCGLAVFAPFFKR